jgi:hypothetical protein
VINQIKSNVIHNIKSNEDLSELCLDIAEAYQRIMKRNEKSRKEVEDLIDEWLSGLDHKKPALLASAKNIMRTCDVSNGLKMFNKLYGEDGLSEDKRLMTIVHFEMYLRVMSFMDMGEQEDATLH